MNWMTIALALLVFAVFIVTLVLVRIKERDDKNNREYLKALDTLKKEYDRSLRLSDDYKDLKESLLVRRN